MHSSPTHHSYAQHFQFPSTLGDSHIIDWDSSTESTYVSERRVKNNSNSSAKEPFILFEFLEVEGSPDKSTTHIGWDDSLKSIKKLETPFLTSIQRALIDAPIVKRNLRGSVALYMTTDIQINDVMNYAEDTRKFAAVAGHFGGEFEKGKLAKDAATDLAGANITALTTAFGSIGKALGALAGYGLGDIIATEYTRITGKVTNPNEFLNYQSTGLRSFSFSFKFLPSSRKESEDITEILKMFRSAAHATKKSAVILLVPDHIAISFYGGKDMIQIPPVIITGVSTNTTLTTFLSSK